MSEWISVEDSLPSDDDLYIIYPYDKYIGITCSFNPWGGAEGSGRLKNKFESENDYGEIYHPNVTHWMPVPVPDPPVNPTQE